MVKPKLTYFDITFWKGEIPRLCFFLGGIDFEDKRVNSEEFMKMKENGDIQFGQLPVLEYEGKTLTQSCAIMRFIGKKGGLMPTDDFEAAKVDEVLHILEELQGKISPTNREKDPAKKKAMRQELANNIIPNDMKKFEKLLGEKKTYFAGDMLTIADLCVWKILLWVKSGIIDDVPPSCVEGYPAVDRNFQAVDSHPKIVEWKKLHATKYSK